MSPGSFSTTEFYVQNASFESLHLCQLTIISRLSKVHKTLILDEDGMMINCVHVFMTSVAHAIKVYDILSLS